MKPNNKIKSVCVYCASSRLTDDSYNKAASDLGKILATKQVDIVYGGGGAGLMGHLANEALKGGGKVFGIIPKFMVELEWGHQKCTELIIVSTMHERKKRMIENVDAVIALPGGCGTFEELIETITLKRLGLFTKPIIIVNTNKYYDHLIGLFENAVEERFMNRQHLQMWSVVEHVKDVLPAINNAPAWTQDAHQFAAVE